MARPGERILRMLEREDKWFLGVGRNCIWAPDFPLFVETPGFWDAGTFLDWPIDPGFTVTVLDEALREIPARCVRRRWRPSDMRLDYAPAGGIALTEERCVLPEDVFLSRFTIRNRTARRRRLHLVMWTVPTNDGDERRPHGRFTREERASKAGLAYVREFNDAEGGRAFRFAVALGASTVARSWSVNCSEWMPPRPWWRFTPFYEKMTPRGLPKEHIPRGGIDAACQVYLALHCVVELPARGTREVSFAMAAGWTPAAARRNLRAGLALPDPIGASRQAWCDFFESVPAFECDDPYIERAYWYRWYGLHLNTLDPRIPRLPRPFVCEGINPGWFRHLISYSAQVLPYDLRWMHDPSVARGQIENLILNQSEDGQFPNAVLTELDWRPAGKGYLGNWGRTVRKIYAVHGDRRFIAACYEGLSRYARYLERERDREGSGLYDIINQWETGQEYMSRYLFADPEGDRWGPLRLKAVDATAYAYELKRALAWMARILGKESEARCWDEAAERTRRAVRSTMWDERIEAFCDVHPETWERYPHLSPASFYPFMSDLAGKEHLGALRKHLLNPAEFWTRYPVPSSSRSDPYYSPWGEWKGKRHCCPWNGRSWLMGTSHACEALAHAAVNLDRRLRPKAAALLRRFVRMTFAEGDVGRPTSYEYYNPETGAVPYFRGTDDYMHSYLVDLIIEYVAGFRPGEGREAVVDPLPFGLERFRLSGVRCKGRTVEVSYRKGRGLLVKVDGRTAARAKGLAKLRLEL